LATTFAFEKFGRERKYVYTRTSNPTRFALEKNICSLEEGFGALAFSSGMAAISSVMFLLKMKDHVVSSNDIYGGTYRFFEKILVNYGLEFSYVDATKTENVENAVRENTKMVWLESPTNPTLKLSDIKEISKITSKKNLILVVDNTFMTPYFQNPLKLGACIVVHSATKYLGGHSDVLGGLVVTSHEEIYERLKFIQNSVGAVLSPFDSFLVLRGIKTLSLRMERHNKNAEEIAQYLEAHPRVKKVYYPGLKSHPQHALAKKQMSGFGGILSFELKNTDAVEKLLNGVELCTLAESLGACETLIEHPQSMTHASMPRRDREKAGITEELVRLSVGLEDVEDIIEDIEMGI
ncbi:MAG: trans-sulfuration enzyme family protein, partial [Candidatus Methanofastidiosia archaeon]